LEFQPRSLSQGRGASAARLARQAFQKAVELDPTLAEGYTALAELAALTPPGDVDEAIMLATIATRLNPNNFGARRIMARLYTIKSGLGTEKLTPNFTRKSHRRMEGSTFVSIRAMLRRGQF
jgi:tetratricopeptide (TPR) repeat protein